MGIATQMYQLKDLTDKTGVIHEAQIQNLRMWILIAVPNLRKYTLGMDLYDKRIEYTIQRSRWGRVVDFFRKENARSRYSNLQLGIRWLLGDTYTLRVMENKKVLYETPKNG